VIAAVIGISAVGSHGPSGSSPTSSSLPTSSQRSYAAQVLPFTASATPAGWRGDCRHARKPCLGALRVSALQIRSIRRCQTMGSGGGLDSSAALDCVNTGFLGDGVLDKLPAGSTLDATRIGGVDLNKPRMRDALRAALALAPARNGFTVAEFTAKAHALTGADHCGYSIRQAANNHSYSRPALTWAGH
jgi:hypothetical protein